MNHNTIEQFNLPGNFPLELFKNGISLEKCGIKELGWRFEDAIKVIEFLTSDGYAILGGDIYEYNDDQINPTHDSWYLNKDNLRVEEYLFASRVKAVSYVEEYYKNHQNSNYLCVVVYKKV